MMKFFSVSVAFLVALAASRLISPTYAQDESAPAAAESSSVIPVPKIAIINGQKIMRESLAAQSLLKQVDLVRRKERDRIAKLEDTLRDVPVDVRSHAGPETRLPHHLPDCHALSRPR